MPEPRRKGIFAFGRQTAVGTPLTQPTYALPVISGSGKPVRERAALPAAPGSLARLGDFVQRARGGGTIQLLAHPDALGLLVYEVMGAQTVAGTGPYTHTFTMADAPPLPMTAWSLVGDQWWKLTDTYLTRLTGRGVSGENVIVEIEFMSLDAVEQVAAPTYTLVGKEPRYKYIGSTVKLEADAATPVTVTNIESVELAIVRGLNLRYGSGLRPALATFGERVVDFAALAVYDTAGLNQGWDFLRVAHTGLAAAAQPLSQLLTRGSFEVLFGRHPADAARSLKVFSNGAAWEYAVERPDSDASSTEPLEYDISGAVVSPDGVATEVTVELKNDVVAVY